jgi:hypothetical protein
MTPMYIILAASADQLELIFKFALIAVALILFGVKVQRIQKSHKLFEEFAEDNNLSIVDSGGSFFFPSLPTLNGKINGYDVDLFVKREKGKWRGRWNYFTVIRVHSKTENSFSFSIVKSDLGNQLISKLIDLEVVTGFADFDSMYKLKCNDQDVVLKVFDQNVCLDFNANPEAFARSGLEFQSGCMVFKEQSVVSAKEHMERYSEILLFMVHLTEKIDSVFVKQRR